MLKYTVEVRKYHTYLGDGPRKVCMFFDRKHEILIDANVQTLNLNRPYKFVKLTTLEEHIQTFQILTQRHSSSLNWCSGAVPTHSLAFMRTHWVFRGCSILTHRCPRALTSIQWVFNTPSLAFTCTHKCSGCV